MLRIQVKSTSYARPDDYRYKCFVNPVRGRYAPDALDFIAACVIPEDMWYIIPFSRLKTRTITLDPRDPATVVAPTAKPGTGGGTGGSHQSRRRDTEFTRRQRTSIAGPFCDGRGAAMALSAVLPEFPTGGSGNSDRSELCTVSKGVTSRGEWHAGAEAPDCNTRVSLA